MYINPLTKIYASFTEAKEDFGKYGVHIAFFEDNISRSIVDIAKGFRNLIVGEPGIGKTELIKKLQEYHDAQGDQTCLINLRSEKPIEEIENFLSLQIEAGSKKILLLDGLDETKATNLTAVLQKIEIISKEYPDLYIYISSRWVFINKYASTFPQYRFTVVLPFTSNQVLDYLIQAGHSSQEAKDLLSRMQFNHGKLILQIPRYLVYFEKYIQDKGITNVVNLSRNDLFDYFIYSKLDLEEQNLDASSLKEAIKRVLEKLALTMEIYQNNTISRDELMTFFDDIRSDLKLVILSQIDLETFIEKTILQPSTEDLNRIEFENTEFQEYLAAKEITRFDEPHRVTFNFATDENAKEIHPSWFNTLTFLVDLLPGILEQLLEFSGITKGEYKIADDSFLGFLSRIDTTKIPSVLRHRVFVDVLNYHERTLQWLPGSLASALPNYFSSDIELELKKFIEKAEAKTGANRYVVLGNTVYVIAYLLRAKISVDFSYWREKLISYTKEDTAENGVLQRHALYALEELSDPSVIEELPDLSDIHDELVAREFLSTVIALDPDNAKSLNYSIAAVRMNNLSGRYGLYEIKKKESIVTFLKTYIEDEHFRKEFLDDSSIVKEQDEKLVSHIVNIFDNEIKELCKQALVISFKNYLGHHAKTSVFIMGILKLLKEKEPGFLTDLLQRLLDQSNNNVGLYFAQDFLVEIIDLEDVYTYLDFMIEHGEINSAMTTMMKIKFSKRDSWEEIYEKGRLKLSDKYTEWEAAQNRDTSTEEQAQNEKWLSEFRRYLEPAPNQYMAGVFNYYVTHADKLDPLLESADKERLTKLITEEALRHNPATFGLTIEEEHDNGSSARYTSSQVAHIFGDALLAAKRLGIDITPYRSNIALHIPFAYHNELEGIFDLIKDFTSAELAPVIEIYKTRNTDLWRHMPESFIKLVERFNVTEAVPILHQFVTETNFNAYRKNEAMRVAAVLSPDASFLKMVFDKYITSKSEEEKGIAYTANGLLITIYGDKDAINWRLSEIKNRAVAFVMPRSGQVHTIGPNEEELRHGKPFAKPLMELKTKDFENVYLEILDSAMDVWNKGVEFQAYAQYMWEIVYAYFDNLKEYGSYEPLKLLEKRIAQLKDRAGANWLASSMVRLRRSYLQKPSNISEAVRKYNEAKTYSDKKIQNSNDLFVQIQNVIETDLRTWVEGEGAYNVIVSEKKYKGNANHEDLVQKTIKTQLSYHLLKKGLQVEITREEQLLDGKRTDLIVRYGFVGPIIIEVKLSSHGDVRARKIENSESYTSMQKYMSGYSASHGIFLIMDNTGKKPHIENAKKIFSQIQNVTVTSLDCYLLSQKKRKPAKTTTRTKVKTKKENYR